MVDFGIKLFSLGEGPGVIGSGSLVGLLVFAVWYFWPRSDYSKLERRVIKQQGLKVKTRRWRAF